MPGVTRIMTLPDRLANAFGFGGAGDKTVNAKRLGLLGPPPHHLGDAEAVARLDQVRVVAGGQHRHAKERKTRASGARDRGAHRLRIGVDGEKGCAKPRRLRGRPLDGIGNVMQLEVEKDPLAGVGETTDERQTFAAVGEFHADLIEDRRVADCGDKLFGRCRVGDVERDDQPVAGVKGFMRGPGGPVSARRLAGLPLRADTSRPSRAADWPRSAGRVRRRSGLRRSRAEWATRARR